MTFRLRKDEAEPSMPEPYPLSPSALSSVSEEIRGQAEAYAAARSEGQGVVVVDGKLIEKLHVDHAKRVVALGEAISVA